MMKERARSARWWAASDGTTDPEFRPALVRFRLDRSCTSRNLDGRLDMQRDRTACVSQNVAQTTVVAVGVRDKEPRLLGREFVGILEVSVVLDSLVMVVTTAMIVTTLEGRRVGVTGMLGVLVRVPHVPKRHEQERRHQPQGRDSPKPTSPLSCRQSFEHAHRALDTD